MKSRTLTSIIYLLFLSFNVIAQKNQPLFLEDIYKNNIFIQKGFGPVRWMNNNDGYSTLEVNTEIGGKDIVRYEAKTGRRSVVISASSLVPHGENKPLIISDYVWSEDNSKLLVFTNTRKVWRFHTRGDYWILNLNDNTLSQLGESLPEATLMFAKFSSDASKVAYVSQNNIFVEDLMQKSIRKITSDGSDTIINGTFDWVYEEELNCRDGFRWSPDRKSVV